MRSIKVLTAILLSSLVMFVFTVPSDAKNDNNLGNAIGLVDEAIGAIVKGVAVTYLEFVDFDSRRSKALSLIAQADEKSFDKYYSQVYHRVQNKIPYEVFPYCGIPSSMTKSQAMGMVSSFNKDRARQIIDSIPNAVAGACFRRLVNDKFHGNPTEADVREAANELGQEVVNKIR